MDAKKTLMSLAILGTIFQEQQEKTMKSLLMKKLLGRVPQKQRGREITSFTRHQFDNVVEEIEKRKNGRDITLDFIEEMRKELGWKKERWWAMWNFIIDNRSGKHGFDLDQMVKVRCFEDGTCEVKFKPTEEL